jgi:hypothetical protein
VTLLAGACPRRGWPRPAAAGMLPARKGGVVRESFSAGALAVPAVSPGRSGPAPPRHPRGKQGQRRGPRRPAAPPPARPLPDAEAPLLPPGASAPRGVTIQGGSSPLTRSRSSSVDEIRFWFFTWDGLRELLATIATLLPVLAAGLLIGLVVFYGFRAQCACSYFPVAFDPRTVPANITTSTDEAECCLNCESRPYEHRLEDAKWTPTCYGAGAKRRPPPHFPYT